MTWNVRIRDGHHNNWTILRLVMALAVLVGHAMIISQRSLAAEPMVYADYSISYMAVNAFFIASGFLVTASIMHRRNILDFATARGLRIYPALIVHVLLVMFVVGAANTALPLGQYIASPDVWKHIPLVLSFSDTDFVLPGVFLDNHEHLASAPLWTLRYELLAYFGTAIAFAVGFMRSRWLVAAQFALFCALWLIANGNGFFEDLPPTVANILRFGLPYSFGAMVWAFRDDLCFRVWLLPLVMFAAVISAGTLVGELIMNGAVGYVLFTLAYMPVFANNAKWSDVSYGTYIWHWPILQWIAAKAPGIGSLEITLLALPLTLLVSWVSWKAVEKPMLAHKGTLARKLQRRKPVLA